MVSKLAPDKMTVDSSTSSVDWNVITTLKKATFRGMQQPRKMGLVRLETRLVR